MQLIKNLWNGEKPLPATFWGMLALLITATVLFSFLFIFLALTNLPVFIAAVIFYFCIWIFALISVWNAESNHRKNLIWFYLAQAWSS